jgi:hypothetical protein
MTVDVTVLILAVLPVAVGMATTALWDPLHIR